MKYKDFNVEPYLNILESEKFESYMIAEINDEDYNWEDKDEIDEDGLYVEDFDSYLYKIVYNGEIIFEIY